MNSETPVKTPTAVQSEHVDSSFLSTNLHKSPQRSVTLILKCVTDRRVKTIHLAFVKTLMHSLIPKKKAGIFLSS